MAEVMSCKLHATALFTSIPDMQYRGFFMSINYSFQQMAGGIVAVFAGTMLVQKGKMSPLEHYDTLEIIIGVVLILSRILMYRDRSINQKKVNKKKKTSNFTPPIKVVGNLYSKKQSKTRFT